MISIRFSSVAAAIVALMLVWTPRPADALLVEVGDFVAEIERLRDLTFTSGSNLYVAPHQSGVGGF
jgi:hypothetical protein